MMKTLLILALSLAAVSTAASRVQPVSEQSTDNECGIRVGRAATIRPPVGGHRTGECLQFNYTFCNSMGQDNTPYSHARFPNARGQSKPRCAAEELDHYIINGVSNCSLAMGPLLCFHYFPFCDPLYGFTVKPCRSVCEQAQRECVDDLRRLGAGWPEHMDCSDENKFTPDGTGEPCVMLPTSPSPVTPSSTDVAVPELPASGDDSTEALTDPLTPEQPTRPSEPPSSEVVCDVKCPACKIRGNCSSNTFVRNDYTFAARVQFVSELQAWNRTFIVNVSEQYCQASPQMEPRTTIYTNAVSTEDCCAVPATACYSELNVTLGIDYLIAGYFTFDDQGIPTWHLYTEDSLVAEWKSKWNKRMSGWVDKGNC